MSTYVMATQKNFATFDAMLQGRNHDSKTIDNHTKLVRIDADTVAIRLHDTNVVTYTRSGLCILRDGGWATLTTRERISNYSPANMGVSKRTQYIGFNGKRYQFYDGIVLNLNTGEVEGGNTPDLNAMNAYNKELTKRVKKYVAGYTFDVVRECLDDMGGDCWYCRGLAPDSEAQHVWEHVSTGYYLGSMVINAYKARGYGDWRGALSMHVQGGDSWGLKELHTTVKKYLIAQLWNKNYSLTVETEE